MFSDRIREGDKMFFAHAPFTGQHVFLNVFSPGGERSRGVAGPSRLIYCCILVSKLGPKIECIIDTNSLGQTCANKQRRDFLPV